MSDTVTRSWVGESAYTASDADAVTAGWYDQQLMFDAPLGIALTPLQDAYPLTQAVLASTLPMVMSLLTPTFSSRSPEFVIPGYTSDGVNINIPISTLPGLSSLEANAVSGDWREIFQAICLRSQFWLDERGVEGSLDTYSSFYLQNPNAKSSLFKYGIGEQNTFLEKFTVAYRSSKLKSEN